MILKQTDKKETNDKFRKSGAVAEEKMSFYLERAFRDNDEIAVINDLRLEKDGDHAQIDHLIVHTFGFVIVESKSVTTKVAINSHGEWIRTYGGQESGMPSPIQQAKRQVDFLKKFILDQDKKLLFRESLANKIMLPNVKKFKYNILVAISDNGIIERDNINLPEIHKADTVTESIIDIIALYQKKINNPLNFNIPIHLHRDSIKKLSNFLVDAHTPLISKSQKSVKEKILPVEPKQQSTKSRVFDTQENFLCKACKSPNLKLLNGQYGYYFKCLHCNKNTKLNLVCTSPTPKCNPLLQVNGLEYMRICEACGEKKHFFTNPPEKMTQTSKPLVAKSTKSDKPTSTKHKCDKCQSQNIEILYAKYGYYFKCKDCDHIKNIKGSLTCSKPSCKPRLKKEKLNFYKVCDACDKYQTKINHQKVI